MNADDIIYAPIESKPKPKHYQLERLADPNTFDDLTVIGCLRCGRNVAGSGNAAIYWHAGFCRINGITDCGMIEYLDDLQATYAKAKA